jgi:putative membrane protein insertion efficiency factor
MSGAWQNLRRMQVQVALWLIRLYRAALSPLLGPSCRFVPTCSCYGEEAISRFGLLRGGALTLWRILRCHPFAKGGLDLVPPAGAGFAGSTRGSILPVRPEGDGQPHELGLPARPLGG